MTGRFLHTKNIGPGIKKCHFKSPVSLYTLSLVNKYLCSKSSYNKFKFCALEY